MKKNELGISTLIFVLFLAVLSYGQVSEQEAKNTTELFFSLCKKNDFQNSAKVLAYYGADKARLYKDFFNPKNPDELKEVKRICKKVNATLLISDSFSFGQYSDQIVNGEKLKSLEVQFLSGSQKIKRKILFIKIEKAVAIFDYN
ncbi:MAG: hypothetical protein KKF62_04545 [Bacteroidetes bacterium]|nr:hypothetical protein [Bacteroidota bacterium]MBU1116702.1 hypothetical protein [Bacteroidota bacterium]MBU1800066.1 hypothetical protein [Bacteroidota bacterium]